LFLSRGNRLYLFYALKILGSEITFQSITHYNGGFQPFVIFSLLVTGGLIAFLMEMSEYLLLMATSGITLNILGKLLWFFLIDMDIL
jgi:hypothetical protein